MPEPEDGWLLEDVEAALYQAEAMRLIMPREKFITKVGKRLEDEYIGSML
jgi:hypothetical protein